MNTDNKIKYWEEQLSRFDHGDEPPAYVRKFISDLKELKEAQEEQIRLHEKALDITTDQLMGVQAQRNELKGAAQPAVSEESMDIAREAMAAQKELSEKKAQLTTAYIKSRMDLLPNNATPSQRAGYDAYLNILNYINNIEEEQPSGKVLEGFISIDVLQKFLDDEVVIFSTTKDVAEDNGLMPDVVKAANHKISIINKIAGFVNSNLVNHPADTGKGLQAEELYPIDYYRAGYKHFRGFNEKIAEYDGAAEMTMKEGFKQFLANLCDK